MITILRSILNIMRMGERGHVYLNDQENTHSHNHQDIHMSFQNYEESGCALNLDS